MSGSTEALFMALANVEEAARCARTRRPSVSRIEREMPVAVDPAELAAALHLVSNITKQLGETLWYYGRALYDDRTDDGGHSALSFATYDVARVLHTLATPLRRGVRIGGGLNAITGLDSLVKQRQAHNRRHGPGAT